jgi:hypothetical protein
MFEAMITSLQGGGMVLEDITELDNSVTREEAERLAPDLLREIRGLKRIHHLLEDRAAPAVQS